MALWGRGEMAKQVTNGSIERELPAEDVSSIWPKLSVRVPDEMHVELKVLAARRHTTVQQLVLANLQKMLAGAK